MVSSRFSMVLATIVHAANSTGSIELSGGVAPVALKLCAFVASLLKRCRAPSRMFCKIFCSASFALRETLRSIPNIDPAPDIRAPVANHGFSEESSTFDVSWVVEEHQRLKWCISPGPSRKANFSIGSIEAHHRRWGTCSLPECIHASSIEPFTNVCDVFATTLYRNIFPKPGWLIGLNTRASDRVFNKPLIRSALSRIVSLTIDDAALARAVDSRGRVPTTQE